MKKKVEYILIFIVIVLLCTPLLIEQIREKGYKPLTGTYEKADSMKISWKRWKNKSWQDRQEQLLKKNLKIKGPIVRLQHEMDYQLFNTFHMGDLLVGKDGYFFSWGWSDARCCVNHFNSDSLSDYLSKLKVLSSLFEQKGKYLRVIIVPSKEEIFNDKLPDKYAFDNPNNDYKLYKSLLSQYEIPHWDLLDFYQGIMDTSQYHIYSPTSVHWTKYGASFTLFKLLDDINAYFDHKLNQIYIKSTEVSKFKDGDGDTETTLNLMSRLDNSPNFLYPSYEVNFKDNAFKPKMITIADSYYWNIKGCHKLQDIYSMESKYLFYYSTAYYPTWDPPRSVKDLNMIEELKTTDGLVILNSSHNLVNYPFGFQYDIDQVIEAVRSLPDKSPIEVASNPN